MISASFGLRSVVRISDALIDLYETKDRREKAIGEVEKLQDYLEKEGDVFAFLTDHFVPRATKLEVLKEMRKSGLDEYLFNALCFMVDSNLIFHLRLFCSTLRTRLQRSLNIRVVFVYSSFEISKEQKKKIEELWSKRLSKSVCEFVYAIDKSLKLGVKVQVGNYVEEFTVRSNLSLIELKLDSLFV